MRDLAVIADLNQIEVLGILDHHYWGNTDQLKGIPFIGDERWLLDSTNSQAQKWLAQCDFFVASYSLGSQHLNDPGPDLTELRLQRIDILEKMQARVINLIHPGAQTPARYISKYSNYQLGKGILIDIGNLHCAADIEIGDYTVCGAYSNIGHDTKIGKNVVLGPWSRMSQCVIGDNTFIGAQSCVYPWETGQLTEYRHRQHQHQSPTVIVGTNCTIWPNSKVFKDVKDNAMHTTDGRILAKLKYLAKNSNNPTVSQV